MADPQALQRQAIGDASQATADQQKAAADEARAQQEKNDGDAAAAEAQAAELRKRQEANDRQMQAAETARARLVDLADKADQDVGHFKFTDYKDTVPVGGKIGLIVGAALAGLQGKVDPLAQINKNIAQHFEKQKAELSSKEAYAKYRRQGVEDHDRHINDQRLYLEFSERNYREAIAKEAEARGLRSGSPMALARAQQLAAKIRSEGDAKLVDLADKYMQGEERRAHADLLHKKARATSGGGGNGAALDQVIDAASQGKPPAEVAKLARKLGIKDPIGTVKKVYDDLKAGRGGGEVDPKLVVRDVKGEPIGLASSAKSAPTLNTQIRNFHDAIDKLERLRAAKWVSSRSPQFHDAVLAVATTTTAGSTDANVTHEKGTLTNAFGLPDNDAIDTKIAELQNRLVEMKNQLNPLPDGYTDAKSGGGHAPAEGHKPANAPKAQTPKVPASVIEQAKEEVHKKGPHAASARKLLEQQNITVL